MEDTKQKLVDSAVKLRQTLALQRHFDERQSAFDFERDTRNHKPFTVLSEDDFSKGDTLQLVRKYNDNITRHSELKQSLSELVLKECSDNWYLEVLRKYKATLDAERRIYKDFEGMRKTLVRDVQGEAMVVLGIIAGGKYSRQYRDTFSQNGDHDATIKSVLGFLKSSSELERQIATRYYNTLVMLDSIFESFKVWKRRETLDKTFRTVEYEIVKKENEKC